MAFFPISPLSPDLALVKPVGSAEAGLGPIPNVGDGIPGIGGIGSVELPGVGILTPGEGVIVHRIDSPELARFENALDGWFDVRWDVNGATARRFPARITVVAMNEPGSLAQVAAVVAEHDGNIENITMTRRTDDFVEMTIDISVWDLKHLTAILQQLRGKSVVSSAERAR